MDRNDLIGQRIGTWNVVGRFKTNKLRCQCICGYTRMLEPNDVFVLKCPIQHDNRYYDTNGQHLTLMEWAQIVHIPYPVLYCRIHLNAMVIHDALTKPVTQEEINAFAYALKHEHKDKSVYTISDRLKNMNI